MGYSLILRHRRVFCHLLFNYRIMFGEVTKIRFRDINNLS